MKAMGVWLRLVDMEHYMQMQREETERVALMDKLRLREEEKRQRREARLAAKAKKQALSLDLIRKKRGGDGAVTTLPNSQPGTATVTPAATSRRGTPVGNRRGTTSGRGIREGQLDGTKAQETKVSSTYRELSEAMQEKHTLRKGRGKEKKGSSLLCGKTDLEKSVWEKTVEPPKPSQDSILMSRRNLEAYLGLGSLNLQELTKERAF